MALLSVFFWPEYGMLRRTRPRSNCAATPSDQSKSHFIKTAKRHDDANGESGNHNRFVRKIDRA
jgi:hypothetical protein